MSDDTKRTRAARLHAGRYLTTGLLAACAFLFAAASCDSQKKGEPTAAKSPTAAADTAISPAEPGRDDLVSGVYETKEPEDMGPPAPAIFALSGLKGYTEPCGCTLDVMLGGIDRIAGYIEDARKLYPAVHVVDAGDLLFETVSLEEHEIPQERAKVEVVLKGLAAIGVAVTVPGEKDFALGPAYYEEQLAAANIKPIAANLTLSGRALPATHEAKLQDADVLYIGIVDPALYEGIAGVKATAPGPALAALKERVATADATVLLVHGEVPFAKQMLEEVPGADFAVVGHAPRETDQVDEAFGGYTLEPYDQGRYVGILKLYNAGDATGAAFVNARQGSKAELEKIERQIEHVNTSISGMAPAKPGEEPEMALTLRKRLDMLEARRKELQGNNIEVPAEQPAFLWRSIPMDPGYEPDPEIAAVREAYNRKLRELNEGVEFTIPEPAAGEAVFVGTDACSTCHAGAKTFWDATAHAGAMETLEKRHKDFDQKCVGCHVVGWEKPGGSVLGKLHYEASVDTPTGAIPVKKNLADVGCESCHGPGSLHFTAPVDAQGIAQNIIRDPGVEQCQQCHVPEHSPRFDFDNYVLQVTGDGHARGL